MYESRDSIPNNVAALLLPPGQERFARHWKRALEANCDRYLDPVLCPARAADLTRETFAAWNQSMAPLEANRGGHGSDSYEGKALSVFSFIDCSRNVNAL